MISNWAIADSLQPIVVGKSRSDSLTVFRSIYVEIHIWVVTNYNYSLVDDPVE